MASTAQYACGICRERKVRCDRSLPKCRRCDRLNQPCGYQVHSRRTRDDQLKQLQERLAKTEAQLALTTQNSSTTSTSHAQPASTLAPTTASTPMDLDSARETNAIVANGSFVPDVDLFSSFAEDMDSHMTFDWMNQPLAALEPMDDLLLNQPQEASQSTSKEDMSPTDLSSLHDRYFQSVHYSFPFINRDKFMIEPTVSGGPAAKALVYAVALAGCSYTTLEDSERQSTCYNLARDYAERCEREDCMSDLNFIQALLLIGRFEASSQKLERSWLTLGRAAMLCRLLRLHRMDEVSHDQSTESGGSQNSSRFSLPHTEDPVLLEERRRTFWGLYILESYVRTRSGLQCQLGGVKVRNVNLYAFKSLTQYPGLSNQLTIARAFGFEFSTAQNAFCSRRGYRTLSRAIILRWLRSNGRVGLTLLRPWATT